MPVRSDPWSDQWPQWPWPPHRFPVQDHVLGLWWARRMSRQFAGVGVKIPAARLREIMSGAPFAYDESIDVSFALTATELNREHRRAQAQRARRRATHCLVVAGLILAALNLLIMMGYGFVSLALHEPPM